MPGHDRTVSEARPGLDTELVPDGSLAPSNTRVGRAPLTSAPEGTQHVPDLPRFGRFQTVAELGTGAMGAVYRAYDDVLRRAVAIKTLHAHRDVELRERFLREARAIGAVHHPHILAIYSAGTEGETPYLIMELAPGGSLRDRIKAGPVAADTVRQLGIQIARALAAAHAANMLHRDVKPANILCTQDGVWKLADFGIARLPDSTLTITGQFLGSPSYAAPESLRAGEFSPASDVYGLGATLYEAVTGTPPYGDHDLPSRMRKLEQDPPPLRGQPGVPVSLGDAITATLARDPARRPSAEHLAQLLASSEVSEAPVAPAPATWSRTRKLVVAGLVAAALLVVLLATRARPQDSAHVVPPGAPAIRSELRAVPHGEPAEPNTEPDAEPDPSQNETQPMVVDENGNPVDEATARRVLDQLERDNRHQPGSRGRGHHKHKDRDD
jgi:serine/threonine protein kinase